MLVNPSKVQLSERDIEDYIYANPSELHVAYQQVYRWVARQFRVPSGIIDLLGIMKSGHPVVLEIKNTEIKADALTQVCRYAKDIQGILEKGGVELFDHVDGGNCIVKAVIGRSNETKIQFEADALDVFLLTFDIEYSVNVSGPWFFTDEASKEHKEQIEALINTPPMTEIATSLDAIYERSCYAEIQKNEETE